MGTAASTQRQSPTRILIVDDSRTVRHSLRVILEQHDEWKVCEEATNGREAVQKAELIHPDVIVLDLQMPEMNGLEAAKEIRKHSPEIPILMFTIHMSSQLKDEARKVGIRGTCAKTDVGCIVKAVETLLSRGTFYKT